MRANASIKKSLTKEHCEKYLETIDARIEAILSECEAVDTNEQDQGSLVTMKKELHDKRTLKAKVGAVIKELKESGAKSINTTDPDCKPMKSVQGSYAGYNIQAVVDEKHGLIVSSDVVDDNNDRRQFAQQINQANETLGRKCKVACADQGYATTDELEKIDKQNIKVIVPQMEESSHKKMFRYDVENDCYICPEGHTLHYSQVIKESKVYRISKKSFCLRCSQFGVCTKSKRGKTVSRFVKEGTRQRFEEQCKETASQEVYKLG